MAGHRCLRGAGGRRYGAGRGAVVRLQRAEFASLRPGSVILLNDGEEGTEGFLKWAWRELFYTGEKAGLGAPPADRAHVVQALPQIIDGARKAGFQFIPLHQFISPSPAHDIVLHAPWAEGVWIAAIMWKDTHCFCVLRSHHLGGDYSKAERELGWKPRVSFEELITKMVNEELTRVRRASVGAFKMETTP